MELRDPAWLEFVRSRADATLFHHPVWARLLADCYGYRPMAVAYAEHGAISAGMPVIDVSRALGGRRWVSLPFTDRCPPLAGENADELAAGAVELATSSKLDLLELRGAIADHAAVHRDAVFVYHEVAVSAAERENWERLARNHRRNVRIAERAGVRITRGVSASDIETFYALHLRTRRRLGVPVQPRRFFQLFLERVIAEGLGFVLTAYSGALPVASAIFGAWNGTLIYKYSARDERFAKLDANYLLLWQAIRWASENGYHTFDLGRSNVEQEPLRSFKDGWGAREEPLAYSRISRSPVRTHSSGFENAMSLIIRNSGPWVCRTVGELFYRYAT
jgi:CelD/BcsL family acetyltransferase involved in cellulose biosynthesis